MAFPDRFLHRKAPPTERLSQATSTIDAQKKLSDGPTNPGRRRLLKALGGAAIGIGAAAVADKLPQFPTSSNQVKDMVSGVVKNGPIGAVELAKKIFTPENAEAGSFPIDDPSFQQTYLRSDGPLREQAKTGVNRTWMWGDLANTPEMEESYKQAQGGKRKVQYFDKTRMEINDREPTDSIWHVTNGLLVNELISGVVQTGDDVPQPDQHYNLPPSQEHIAGDNVDGPTYASLVKVLNKRPDGTYQGNIVATTLDINGNDGYDETFLKYNVTYQEEVPATNHMVASPFWEFMNSKGPVYDNNGNLVNDLLVPQPFYATGYPITEPYWTQVHVGGVMKDVLVQAFERRILTYTPSNPFGWEVEMGNVGQHYYKWRYLDNAEQNGEYLPDIHVKGLNILNHASDRGIRLGTDPGHDQSTLEMLIAKYGGGAKFRMDVYGSAEQVLGRDPRTSPPYDTTINYGFISWSYNMYLDKATEEWVFAFNIPDFSTDPVMRAQQIEKFNEATTDKLFKIVINKDNVEPQWGPDSDYPTDVINNQVNEPAAKDDFIFQVQEG